MSRTSCWLALSLVLVSLIAASPVSAAPDAPSTVAFLAELSAESPCLAEAQTPVLEIPELFPEPEKRVIYPDCGVFCSDGQCSGRAVGDSCTVGGAPGWCKGFNQVCPNEPRRSPCTCTAF